MSTKVVARALLTLGFLAASIAYSSWTAQRTILDPSATRIATHQLLATPAVNDTLTRKLHDALAPLKMKDTAQLDAAVTAAVRDPKFAAAFEDAIMHLHQNLLSGGSGQVTLDPNAVTDALHRAIARVDPKVEPKAKQLQTVSVPLGASNLPHVGDIRHEARVVGNAAIAIAVLLIGGALLLAPDRKAFRRTGRRVAFLALPPALVFLAIPHLLARSDNSGAAVSAVVLEAFGRRVLFSAVLLAGIGATVWLVAAIAPGRRPVEAEAAPPSPANAPPLPDTRAPSLVPLPTETAVFRP
jgi:hypothetical protein